MSKVEEIYKRLTGIHKDCDGIKQYGQQIAKILGVTHPYIYKVITRLTKEGYIVPQGTKSCPMFYSATAKSFVRRDVTTPTPRDVTKLEPCSEIALQKTRYEIVIEREYTNFFEKQRKHMHGNCAHWNYKTKIFDSMGVWQFEKVGKSKLIIIMPEMIFKRKDLAQAKNTMFTILYEALKWFAHKAKIKYKWNTLHMCQKPHVCRPARDSKAVRVARDFSLNIDGKMLDMSSGKADWETTILDEDMVDMVDALETWDSLAGIKLEMDNFNDRLLNFNDKLGSIDSRVSSLEEMRTEFNKKIDAVIEGMNDIKKMVNPDPKPLTVDDPAFG